MEIDIKEYFTEIIDESRSTIGYSLNPYKDIELVKAIYDQNEQLQQLKQENEELKEKCSKYQNEICPQYSEELQQAYVRANKAKQKLEKIEECINTTCFDYVGMDMIYFKKELLQIIRGESE